MKDCNYSVLYIVVQSAEYTIYSVFPERVEYCITT